MQPPELQRPLSRTELADLSECLANAPGAMRFSEAHGFLTAIASAPTTMMPSIWQQKVLGDRGFSTMEEAKHVIGLVLRLYNQIITALEEGTQVAPSGPDDDAIARWCTGYLRAAHMDDVWNDDERGAVFLFPMAVLSGEADLIGHTDSDGKVIEDPTPQLRRARERLDVTVREANRYWTAWRRKSIAPPVVAASQKVGRNERCPCGSGLKFKKCCALKN